MLIKLEYGINSDEEDAPTTINGTIPAKLNDNYLNTSNLAIFVTPLRPIRSNESITIDVTASTTEPYQKTISCRFTLKPELQSVNTYTIEDAENMEYATLKVTCPNEGTTVTIELDPTKVRIDMNDEVYVNRDDSKTEMTTIDGKSYVKKFIFDLSAETTKYVKFYKVDRSKDYSYPGVETNNPIKVTI